MTHYEKPATMIFRIFGAILLIVGILITFLALILGLTEPYFPVAPWVIFYSIPLTVLGILLFSGSRKLAKWICFDFNKLNER